MVRRIEGSMLDKLDVVIPRAAEFSRDFAALYRDVGGDPKYFRHHQHYQKSGDLRKLGYSSMLHLYSDRPNSDGNHKLELLDVGKMGFREIVNEIERVFDIDPYKLPRSMKLRIPGDQVGQYEDVSSLPCRRVDLCTDVELPVTWFKDRTRAQFKRWGAKIGKIEAGTVAGEPGRFVIEYAEMGMGAIQTLYFGKRPNCIRFYDKLSELQYQFNRAMRNVSQDADPITFDCYVREQFPGRYTELPGSLTRVERQIGAGVPRAINTLDRLKKNAADYNPFERVEIAPDGKPFPAFEEYRGEIELYALAKFVRELIESQGFDVAYKQLNRHGHAKRLLRRVRDFLPNTAAARLGVESECIKPELVAVTAKELFERYRDTVSKQLAA